MKKITFLFMAIAIAFLYSCSDSFMENNPISSTETVVTLTPNEYISVSNDNPHELSDKEVQGIIDSFIYKPSTRAYAEQPHMSIVKRFYLTSKFNSSDITKPLRIPVCEVKLDSGYKTSGYAVVSCDSRNPSVIAYIENGSLESSTKVEASNLMLNEAENAFIKTIEEIELIKDSLREKTRIKIANELGSSYVSFSEIEKNISVVNNGDITRSQGYSNPTGAIQKQVANLITTTWDQCSPYNDLMDPSTNSDFAGWPYYGKNPLGCTAVTVAQIVAKYECLANAYGQYLNWSQIKSHSSIYRSDAALSSQVAKLCKHVALGISTSWSNAGGSAKISDAYSYLNNLGVTFDTGKKFKGYSMDASRIMESLDLLHPVIITGPSSLGGRHCWLLDGYRLLARNATTRAVVRQNDMYVHANFGWGGLEDGYYLVDRGTTNLTFETKGNGNYSSNLTLYPNVRKK